MISVVIPTLNAGADLPATLTALVPAAVSGLVREVILVDGGSGDATLDVADDAGARVLHAGPGRGAQLQVGCEAARGDWLLLLHADTRLDPGWEVAAIEHMSRHPGHAGYFRFALNDLHGIARVWERGVALRCWLFRLPYGDQGLLMSKGLYQAIGGLNPMPLMEDVDLVLRLGRRRLRPLQARALTSALRFQRQGYFRRSAHNISLLLRFLAGVRPETLARYYD